METKTVSEHEWLQQLVGEWLVETGFEPGPEESSEVATGEEAVRSIGDVWVVAEGRGEIPDSTEGTWVMTLGFDVERGRFVGSWIGSMMTHMFIYSGSLDEEEKVLTLETLGPDMKGQGAETRYRDVITIGDHDRRTLTSFILNDDGEWQQIMRTSFRRKA